jgi:peptidoglycan/LPS O-acetylase OafA/YrhL
MNAGGKENRVDVIEFLRGIAAMMVVLYHYSTSTLPSIKPNPLAPWGAYGKYGVEMFFVISGFVIYLTLTRIPGRPALLDLRRFLLRRTVRVLVPAWAALALTFVVSYAAYLAHKPIDRGWIPLTAQTAVCNVTMTCGFASGVWMNAVYWTLEIELCFYALFGVLYYAWRGHARRTIASYFALGVAAWWFLGPAKPFFAYMLTFLVGVVLADVLVRGASRVWAFPVAAASLAVAYLQAGTPTLIFCGVAAVAIYLFYRVRLPERALFLGTISFSLYLTHTLIAYFAEGVLKHTHAQSTGAGKVVMLLVYAAIATAWAYGFYRLIEAPVVKRARALLRTTALPAELGDMDRSVSVTKRA